MTTLNELSQRIRILERDANTRADNSATLGDRIEQLDLRVHGVEAEVKLTNSRLDRIEQRLESLGRLEADVRRILQILEASDRGPTN